MPRWLVSEDDQLPLVKLANPATPDDEREQTRTLLLNNLIDRHGTGRLLFRNTRATVKGFPERQLHTYPLELPLRLRRSDCRAGQTKSIRCCIRKCCAMKTGCSSTRACPG